MMILILEFCPEFRWLSLEEIDLIFETKPGSSGPQFPSEKVKLSVKLQQAKVLQRKQGTAATHLQGEQP